MSAFHDSALIGASGSQGSYQISRSVRLRRSASGYFNRTPASASNRKTWTWSGWVKRSEFSATAGIQVLFDSRSGASDNTVFGLAFGNGTYGTSADGLFVGQYNYFALVTTQVFRDPSAWYHIVLALDTTQATAANRMKLYVNGVQITTFNSTTYPALNADLAINLNQLHTLGSQSGSSNFTDGYLTDINFIDGQGLTPSSFGEFNALTGVWTAKKYSGSYGTNGFSVNFSDNSAATAAAIGKDSSGNGNNWTPNNISVTAGVTYDSMIDTPTPYADGGNGRGNYAVLNNVDLGYSATTSEANLKVSTASSGNASAGSTIAMSANTYWEVTIGSNSQVGLLWGRASAAYDSSSISLFASGATGSLLNATRTLSATPSWSNGDTLGFAWNSSTRVLTLYQAGSATAVMTILTPATGDPQAVVTNYSSGSAMSSQVNFGQRPFTYTPPSGFLALNTQNLPASTIDNGAAYMAATLYTGNNATQSINNAVNNVSFQPDFVWIKNRSTASQHVLTDSVRGVTKQLFSSLTNAEQTSATGITSLNTNGFSLGSNVSPVGDTNSSPNSFVSWQWKASNAAAVTNTAGSISSQVSANVSAGFSVVTYTGTGANATVGHGLGVAPSMVIAKNRTSGTTDVWLCYHSSLGATKYLILDRTDAAGTASTAWNNTAPTSSVFSIGTLGDVNRSTNTYVAYCFAEVAGYSKFGSYVGNGSTDGSFVHLGFRPRWVMIKASTGAAVDWQIYDTSRSSYNASTARLYPNQSYSELTAAGYAIDILSNGFKLRTDPDPSYGTNGSGITYIYAAFAENPFKNSLAR